MIQQILLMFLLVRESYDLPAELSLRCETVVRKNLSLAEDFLDSTVKDQAATELKPHQLYCKTLRFGDGSAQVKETDCPTLLVDVYEINELGEQKLSYSIRPAKKINLPTCIEGLREGVKGMTAGEKRRIFAHPSLTHGDIGFKAPEHYLIFDVELVSVR